MTTQINIFKGTRSIIKWFQSMTISMTDGFCHSIDLSLNSLDLWNKFDPNVNKGDLTIKVLIGTTTYEFMCEERDVPIEINGSTFSVWGRSRQARLDVPYARTVKDTEDTEHPWQTGDVSVSNIIKYVIDNYCDYPLTFSWNVEDFLVKEGTFSVDEQTPISIISSFADIIGAKLIAHPDGSLTVETYSVEEQIPVVQYNDFDDIVSLNESNQYTEGYNAITISGKNATTSPQIQHEVLEEDEEKTTSWEVNVARTVRVYYYHKDYGNGVSILEYPLSGISASSKGGGVETINEDVLLTWGSGSKSKFDKDGLNDIEGDSDTPLELRSVSYQTNYLDYSVTVSTKEETHLMFYFSDKTANTVLSVDIDDTKNSSDSDQCSALGLDMVSDKNDDTKFKLKLYGNRSLVFTGYDLANNSIPVPSISDSEKIEEFLSFTDGEGSLSKPYSSGLSYSFPGKSYVLRTTVGSTKITADGASEDMEAFGAFVSYTTNFYYENRVIPNIFLNNPDKYTSYEIYFPTSCDNLLSASLSISDKDAEKEDEESQSNVLSLMLEDELDGDDAFFRVYGNPDFIDIMYDMNGKSLSVSGLTKELIEETLTFTKGEANLSKPYHSGMISNPDVTVEKYTTKATIEYNDGLDEEGNEDGSTKDKMNTIVSVKYSTSYSRGSSTLSEEDKKEYTVFLEKTDGGTLSDSKSYDVEEDDDDTATTCDVQIELESKYTDSVKKEFYQTNDLTKRSFYFRYYGDPTKFKRAYSSTGDEVILTFKSASYVGYPFDLKYKIDGYETINEQIQITGGKGQLSWPCCSEIADHSTRLSSNSTFELVNFNENMSEPTPTVSLYGKTLTLSKGPDYEGESKNLLANVTYINSWINGYLPLSLSLDGEVTIYVETTCGELLSVSTTVEDVSKSEYRSVVINVKDYTTEVNILDAEVYIDDIFQGKTGSDGILQLHNIQVGDHNLRLVKEGYLNSEEDDLSNSTFTVE